MFNIFFINHAVRSAGITPPPPLQDLTHPNVTQSALRN